MNKPLSERVQPGGLLKMVCRPAMICGSAGMSIMVPGKMSNMQFSHTAHNLPTEALHMVAPVSVNPTIGALIIKTGFWGPLYYKHNKEPPKS